MLATLRRKLKLELKRQKLLVGGRDKHLLWKLFYHVVYFMIQLQLTTLNYVNSGLGMLLEYIMMLGEGVRVSYRIPSSTYIVRVMNIIQILFIKVQLNEEPSVKKPFI